MCLLALGKFDFLCTNFFHNYPPISILFLIEKHPILPKLGAFYNNLLKIHLLDLCNLSSFVSDETHQSIYQILWKSTSKYVYHFNVRTPSCFRSQILSNTGTFFVVPVLCQLWFIYMIYNRLISFWTWQYRNMDVTQYLSNTCSPDSGC